MAEIDARPAPLALSASAARRIAALVLRRGHGRTSSCGSASRAAAARASSTSSRSTTRARTATCWSSATVPQVVVDGMSLMYVIGSELDYVEDLTGSYFKVRNPNASSSCGCGTSFAV